MKKLILFFIITTSLFSNTFYTLDNIKNLRIFTTTSTNFLDKQKISKIENIVKERLLNAGFIFGGDASATFMIKIEATELENVQAIYVEISIVEELERLRCYQSSQRAIYVETSSIVEELKTLRDGDVYCFSITYFDNDFIKSDDPYTDVLESLDFLILQFLELLYKIDNE